MTIQQATVRRAPLAVVVTPNPINVSRSGSGALTANITVVATGGCKAYTRSASWLSGGSGLLISLPSSDTPSVSGVEAPPTVRTGTLRFAVTSGSESLNTDVSATFTWNA